MNHFSIDYAEYHIAGLLQNDFKKQNNFSINIPISRQQKYYDLLLFNGNKNKCLTIQVKSSRTYIYPNADTIKQYHYYAWLNSFNIDNNYSDYYFIFISFPSFDTKTFRPKTGFGTNILIFEKEEMKDILSNIKKTKKGTPDKFFSFCFNIDDNRIFGDRGFDIIPRKDFTDNLYQNKISSVTKKLG